MQQYIDAIDFVLKNGTWQENRTGIRTIRFPGHMMRFNLQQGYPAVTTKKLAFKAITGETCGFLRGVNSAKLFRELGCKVWDQNANENAAWLANPYREGEDHLGEVYGVQWRKWPAYKEINQKNVSQILDAESKGFRVLSSYQAESGETFLILYKAVDQIRYCLDTIMNNPSDRRILFHGWNWAQLDQMALPPCHLLYQFLPDIASKELSLCMYVRSNDLGLGAPFNIAEGALLLELFAHLTGYKAKWLTYFIGDAHIYENHLDMVATQLERIPFEAPKLIIKNIPAYADTGVYDPSLIDKLTPDCFELENYKHHPPITAPMAV